MDPDQGAATGTGRPGWTGRRPSVLVFDVNETLLDFDMMRPLFERIFGDKRVLRQWIGQLSTYSMTLTLSGLYTDFYTLGQGLLRMIAAIDDVRVDGSDVDELRAAMLRLPPHPDVPDGLTALREAGFRMVSLTNSPSSGAGLTPLEHARIGHFFERQFTAETVRAYKPAHQTYHMVAQELGVRPSACMMVAAHAWDTVGAQSAGFAAGLIRRPGNAPLPIASLPQPDVVVPDLPRLAAAITARYGS